jgi:hypothetical protein
MKTGGLKSIGGEFEYQNNEIKKQSRLGKKIFNLKKNFTINGISAFFQICEILKKEGINEIYIPAFICDCLITPILKSKIKIKFYSLNKNYKFKIIQKKNIAYLVIHYFGIENNIIKILKKKKIEFVEDVSHIYLNKNFNFNRQNKYFFSLRKHGYIGAGGYTNINYNLKRISKNNKLLEENISLRKKKKLFIDNDTFRENDIYFLKKFKKINKKFLSTISEKKLQKKYYKNILNYNFEYYRAKRLENWNYLNKNLDGKFKTFHQSVSVNCVPLGYTILTNNRNKFKNYLTKKRIFTGIHWPLIKKLNKKKFKFEKNLSKTILTIPTDHRYDIDDMKYIVNTIKKFK